MTAGKYFQSKRKPSGIRCNLANNERPKSKLFVQEQLLTQQVLPSTTTKDTHVTGSYLAWGEKMQRLKQATYLFEKRERPTSITTVVAI